MEETFGGGLLGSLGLSSDLLLLVGFLGVAPFLIVSATSFVKLAVIFSLVRNALGVQQIPPNMVIYGLALTITIYIMLPVGDRVYRIIEEETAQNAEVSDYLPLASEPLSGFLEDNADAHHRKFFERNAARAWPEDLSLPPQLERFLILLPAFLITELSEAFEIGFLIYLPFIAIDIVVSNILLALGMMMVSPVTIALPFKLFLFVAADGWTRLVQGLLASYGTLGPPPGG